MAYKPILFNTEMVQAVKEGRKTQTRRVAFVADALREFSCASYPDGWWYEGRVYKSFESFVRDCQTPKCKYRPGDILWVRETWRPAKGTVHTYIRGVLIESDDWHDGFEYRAWGNYFPDGLNLIESADEDHLTEMRSSGNWHPSIHMPKEAARIFLRVKDVRIERLHDISVLDAINEGCCGTICDHADAHPTLGCTDCYNTGWLEPPDAEFALLWDTTVKKADLPIYGWEANPWVWVIEFERCEKPEGWPDV